MPGIVSFSLFGKDPQGIYKHGALLNAQAYGEYYPDAICRFYVGASTLEWASEHLAPMHHVQIEEMGGPEGFTATFWRYRALQDRTFKYHLFRDCDSRPILRERLAVNDWLENSNKLYHVMRDHPYHNMPILAGLWGVKYDGNTQNFYNLFRTQNMRSFYQCDQVYLKAVVWEVIKTKTLGHVDCEHYFGEAENRPFPSSGFDEGFVGEGFYGDGRARFPHHSRDRVG